MIVYVVCRPLGMIYAIHALESDAIDDVRRRNEIREGFVVEKWHVLDSRKKGDTDAR